MSGHSVSEVILSPHRIHYAGIGQPDIMVVLTADGLKTVRSQVARLASETRLYWNAALGEAETKARRIVLDFTTAGVRVTRENMAMLAVAAMLRREGLYPLAALRDAVVMGQKPDIAQANLEAVKAGEAWAQ